jgi:ABC-2 type transport system permease protein
MTASFSSGWNGMATIEDLDRGVVDRLLVTPVRRLPLILGRVGQNLVQVLLQSAVVVAMALAVGVTFAGGALAVTVLVLIAGLLGTAFAALSNALALVARKEESLIGAVTFLQLPLTFLSTAFMQAALLPDGSRPWRTTTPSTGRSSPSARPSPANPDWASVAGYCGLLAGFAIVCLALATKAFGRYRAQA